MILDLQMLAYLYCSTTVQVNTTIVAAGSYPIGESNLIFNDAGFTTDLSANGRLCFNRKTINGNFFLINGANAGRDFIIYRV